MRHLFHHLVKTIFRYIMQHTCTEFQGQGVATIRPARYSTDHYILVTGTKNTE
jgi:hypothetical protein